MTAQAEARAEGGKIPRGWRPAVNRLRERTASPEAMAWWFKTRGMTPQQAEAELQKLLSPPKGNGNGNGQEEVADATAFGGLLRPGAKDPSDPPRKKKTRKVVKKKAAPKKAEARKPARRAHRTVELRESLHAFRESKVDDAKRRVFTVLITEGLGNKRDKNFYGPEAIDSAVHVFEGAQSFLNHLTADEEAQRPEGDVRQLCGQWSGMRKVAVEVDGEQVAAAAGWLNFTSSAAGREGFELAKSAIRFREDLGTDRDLLGVSINANGVSHSFDLEGFGPANYVDEITEATSCDLVTRAGRGGRFLNLMESLRDARRSGDERRVTMARKNLLREAKKQIEKKAKIVKALSESLGDEKFQELLTALAEGKSLDEMDLTGVQDLAKDLQKLTDKGSLDMDDAVSVLGKGIDNIKKGGGDAQPAAPAPGEMDDDDEPEDSIEMCDEMDDDDEKKETDDDQQEGDEEPKPKESARKASSKRRESRRQASAKRLRILESENRELKKRDWLRDMRDLAAEKIEEAELPEGLATVNQLVRECRYGASIDDNEEAMDEFLESQQKLVEAVRKSVRDEDGDYRSRRVEGAGHRRSGETAGDPDEHYLREHGVPLKSKEKKKAS